MPDRWTGLGLRGQIALMVIVVFVFAIGMVLFLNYSKFKSSLEDVVESRLLFVGRNISDSLEQTLALGSSIAAAQPIQGLLGLEKLNDTLILSIDVADDERAVLFSTNPERVGGSIYVPTASDFEDGGHWRKVEDGAVALGIPVRNTFDLQVGTVVLRYASPYLDESAWQFLERTGLAALAMFGLAVVPITLLLWLQKARMLRMFGDIKAPLQDIAAGRHIDPDGELGPFAETVRQAEIELAQIEALADSERR